MNQDVRGRSLPPLLPAKIPWRILFGPDRLQFLRMIEQLSPGLPVIRFSFGTRTVVLVKGANAAGDVLLSNNPDFSKGEELTRYAHPLLGNGLLASDGDFHRSQRTTINPVFAHKRIVSYADTMVQAAEEMAKNWTDGERIDIDRETTRLTLDIVGETLFGVNGIANEADELGNALNVAMRYFIDVLRSPIRPPFSGIPFWRQDVSRALATLDATIFRLMKDRRSEGSHGNDLLSLLLSARDENGDAMSDQQVRDEAMTLFLAGHETTANALAWTFYLLAKNPSVYEKVQNEIDSALEGRAPTYEDLVKMPYTSQAIKEAMRLYPPAFAFTRRAKRDTEIGGFRIPAKTTVIINIYLSHRNPEYFPNPDRFDPDRFTPDAEKSRPRFAYLPFGGGPRVCIGAAFALMESHLVVAALLQRVRFELVHPEREQETETLITLRPKGGIPMTVHRRK